tara:strand:- start:1016 stop:2005 length:990 start_codon:yes stop_codon:yes gene_type:complete
MRLLLLAVCFILTACASTAKSDNYIRTTGVGNTYEEAKNNAFKEAIEYQVGVVIASERESYNEKLVKNEILAYSSAFVDEYKVISQQNIGNKIQVVVDVKLSLLRLSDRILSSGKDSKNIDGAKHYTQYTSFLENKQNGDSILASILNDYPRRAYDIQQSGYVVKIDSNRNIEVNVPYIMQWNPNYVASFNDATKLVADGNLSFLEKNRMGYKYPGSVIIGKDRYYFNDVDTPLKIVYGMLDNNEPRINMELKDHRNTSHYSKCFVPKINYYQFNGSYGTKNLNVYQLAGERGEVSINIHQNSKLASIMKNLFTIELSIVPKKLCAPNV